jgi:hypothetical protein
MDPKETGSELLEWISLAHDTLRDSCKHGNESLGFIKREKFLD